ncbi:hypothetical protein ACHQM5_000250 [Ranunculus cassubicifolius]
MEEVVGDRISFLPDGIILQILSYLKVQEAVSTCVLSKQWRYQWTFIPNLCFDFDFYTESHMQALDQCIKQYQGQELQKFYVETVWKAELDMIHRWLDFAVERNVKDLTIQGKWFTVPEALFSCQRLQSLAFICCYLHRPSDIKCFDSLRHLSLYNVKDYDGAVDSILSKCHRLKTLLLSTSPEPKPLTFSVSLPELRTLHITLTCNVFMLRGPKLQFLQVYGRIDKMDIKNTPLLTDVRFGFQEEYKEPSMSIDHLGGIMNYIANVKTFLITEHVFKLYAAYVSKAARVVFPNCKALHLQHVKDILTVNSFAHFLLDFPSLEELHITFWEENEGDQLDHDPLEEDVKLMDLFGNVRIFKHLKMVTMMYISGCPKQMMLIKFLLEKAVKLEMLHLHLLKVAKDKKELFLELPKVSQDLMINLYDE